MGIINYCNDLYYYPDTIYSGLITLIRNDQEGIALIVFIASILVPIFKILALAFIALTVHFRWQFTIVVITTLFAAESFDTRLIWDSNNNAK